MVHDRVTKALALLSDALEIANWLGHEVEVSKLLYWGLVGLCEDGLVLVLESFDRDIVDLSILHPVDREKVTKARADISSVDNGFAATVCAP